MRTSRTLPMVAFAVMVAFVSVASAGAPMGPPMAYVGEGQWAFGGEYGHENMDLKACGTLGAVYDDVPFEFVEIQEIKDLEMNMFFATIAYGLCDNWDVFLRLGAADAQDDITGAANVDLLDDPGVPSAYDIGSLDGSYGFAWGVGTRATFCRSGPWSFGGITQITWFDPGDSDIEYTDPLFGGDAVHSGDVSIDFWQAQVALAAVYQVDTWRLWAGPFLQFVDGDLDRSGDIPPFEDVIVGSFDASADIDEESQIGGHFGASWDVAEQWNLWAEGQVTGDSWFVGLGVVFLPEETFGK